MDGSSTDLQRRAVNGQAHNSYVFGTLVAVLGAFPGGSGSGQPSGSGAGGADLARQSVSFKIAGEVSRPLSPGVRARLNLRLTNPHRYRLRVRHLTVAVDTVNAPRANRAHPCAVRDFAVQQFHRRSVIKVDAHATGTLRNLDVRPGSWPRVRMLNRPVNQDGCKGAALTLAYSGAATLGRR